MKGLSDWEYDTEVNLGQDATLRRRHENGTVKRAWQQQMHKEQKPDPYIFYLHQ